MRQTSIEIIQILQEAGHTAYWAGGCVRDMLMKRTPMDFDIATSARPEEIEELFGHTKDVGRQFGVMLVIKDKHAFEIATFRSDSGYSDGRRPDAVLFTHAAEDAKRRDFTINGLFYDPIKEEFHDFIGGRDDIQDKIVRFIGDPDQRIQEDHLRLIRAVRFKNTLGFNYHEPTWEAVKRHAHLADSVSWERVNQELNKMMASHGTVQAFEDMKESGLLKAIMPELEKADWGSLMTALKRLPVDAPKLAHWAMVFYHIGTPQDLDSPCSVMRRLRFSRKDREDSTWVMRHLSMLKHIPQMPVGRRRHWFLEPHFPIMLMMLYGLTGESPLYQNLIHEYEDCISRFDFKPAPLLKGKEVMEELKISPGPEVGEIIQELVELQLEHKISSRSEALVWLRSK